MLFDDADPQTIRTLLDQSPQIDGGYESKGARYPIMRAAAHDPGILVESYTVVLTGSTFIFLNIDLQRSGPIADF